MGRRLKVVSWGDEEKVVESGLEELWKEEEEEEEGWKSHVSLQIIHVVLAPTPFHSREFSYENTQGIDQPEWETTCFTA